VKELGEAADDGEVDEESQSQSQEGIQRHEHSRSADLIRNKSVRRRSGRGIPLGNRSSGLCTSRPQRCQESSGREKEEGKGSEEKGERKEERPVHEVVLRKDDRAYESNRQADILRGAQRGDEGTEQDS
jgi:hypothetical protein